jgi:nucleoside 2-deoxyribosyltransferase
MNIYFACSITGGRKYEPVYQAIIEALLANGHDVPTAHLAESDVKTQEGLLSPREVFERDEKWIGECDSLIAEVSTPSHGVGYEIAYALHIGKPVLCLYQAGQPVTKMLTGNTHPNIQVSVYSDTTDCVKIMQTYLESFQL